MKKFILFIIILGIVIGVVGVWYYQKNLFSKEDLKLEILGPESVTVSEEVEYIVKYKNNGSIRLEEARLVFEFPEYTLFEQSFSRRVEKGPEELGDIYPGEEKIFKFKARLFGKEGEAKIATANLSYRPKNLKARFESATTFTTIIKLVPLTFEFDLPSKIESGKEIKFVLNYYSNINYPLSDLRCAIEYPSNFEFRESRPTALEQTEWDLGLLNRAEGGRIEIEGYLRGEIGEVKIFQAKLGIWQEDEFVLLKEATKGVGIVKPSLYISQQINGNPQYAASPGDQLHYEIFFRNIGQNPLTDLGMIIRLEGVAFDFYSIKAPLGEFKSGDNSIVFEGRRIPELQFLDVLKEGKIEFWINLKGEWEFRGPQDKNPIIKNTVYLSQAQEEFVTKVSSKLVIGQNGYFERAGETTTYTITWQVKNYYNDVKNVKVKTILPQGIQLTSKISPEQEKARFAFDSQSREIIWMVGDMEAGKGVLNEPPRVSFQVSLELGQTIINEATITGEDQWTETIIESKSLAINLGEHTEE